VRQLAADEYETQVGPVVGDEDGRADGEAVVGEADGKRVGSRLGFAD
jgi:hypothetical protein